MRKDIEFLAKELCRAYEKGITQYEKISDEEIEDMVETLWVKWKYQSQKIINKMYGNLIDACKTAYIKYAFDDNTIDVEKLEEQLRKALCDILGKEVFEKWERYSEE